MTLSKSCEICNSPFTVIGKSACKECLALSRLIKARPEIARRILDSLKADEEPWTVEEILAREG